jgi:hypothetical protein
VLPHPIVHQQILAGRTTKPVVAVGQIWRSAVGVAKAGRVWKCLDLTSAFLTVVTIANGAQDRLANGAALNAPACARSVSGSHYDLRCSLIFEAPVCVSYFHLWMLPSQPRSAKVGHCKPQGYWRDHVPVWPEGLLARCRSSRRFLNPLRNHVPDLRSHIGPLDGRGKQQRVRRVLQRALAYSGAPRPMKIGNIPSPWCYDVVADNTTAPPNGDGLRFHSTPLGTLVRLHRASWPVLNELGDNRSTPNRTGLAWLGIVS